MSTLSYAQLEGVWIRNGGSPALAPLMAAIAEAESSGNPDARNNTDNGGTQTSWGLWQISNGDHTMPSPNWNDPNVNAQLAVGKMKSQGLRAWGTYTSGAYKRFMSSGTTPDLTGSSPIPTPATPVSNGDANCAWHFSYGLGSTCLISKVQLRTLFGVVVVTTGLAVGLVGVVVLVAYGLKRPGMASALAVVPGVGKLASKAV